MSAPVADPLAEAERALALCRVCGYCTGLCPVFPALDGCPDLRPDPGPGRPTGCALADLDYLASLCHNCRACWYACQYAPPHPFAINVPATLARVRAQTYASRLWPRAMGRAVARDAPQTLVISLAATLLVPLLTLLAVPTDRLRAVHQEAGAFYAVIPWGLMSAVATLTLGWSVLALTLGVGRFWRDIAPARPRIGLVRALPRALRDMLTLRHLDGGGAGCNDRDATFTQRRRLSHLALSYGFLLCLMATGIAALYHHLLDRLAPYPLLSAPVLLGTLGGIAMLAGIAGLVLVKHGADPEPTATETLFADYLLLGQLGAIAATGLALLALRATPAMGLLLALHLGTVLALFVTLPYGKLVHGAFRTAALLRAAMEGRTR